MIEAKAHFDSPQRIVHIRVGGLDGRLYLDLGDKTWRAVEIDAAGWRVINDPPVRFRRAAGMQALPMPVRGGSIEALRSFLNVKSASDFVLVVAWAVAALRDRGPYPVMALSGEQGSAKSTFTAILRALLDPNTAPLRALPREDRDLFIAAINGHVLAFDNVSGLPTWISDTLCRLATGGGFAVRQLYTDQEEVLFDAARPVILNGIEDIVARPDLADRALFLTLEPIPEERRRLSLRSATARFTMRTRCFTSARGRHHRPACRGRHLQCATPIPKRVLGAHGCGHHGCSLPIFVGSPFRSLKRPTRPRPRNECIRGLMSVAALLIEAARKRNEVDDLSRDFKRGAGQTTTGEAKIVRDWARLPQARDIPASRDPTSPKCLCRSHSKLRTKMRRENRVHSRRSPGNRRERSSKSWAASLRIMGARPKPASGCPRLPRFPHRARYVRSYNPRPVRSRRW
jgi:hypothetical protein